MRHARNPYLLCSLILALTGCGSISDSSQSISKIVSSPLQSSSKSSSPEDSYHEDVRDLTASHMRREGSINDLRREIGGVAKRHGITDWEKNPTTYRAVGAGLKKASYSQDQVDGFVRNFADTPEQASWVQKGYDSE